MLDLADRLISKAGPFAAAGIMVGSIYWTAVTYGAVTVMQVSPAAVLGAAAVGGGGVRLLIRCLLCRWWVIRRVWM